MNRCGMALAGRKERLMKKLYMTVAIILGLLCVGGFVIHNSTVRHDLAEARTNMLTGVMEHKVTVTAAMEKLTKIDPNWESVTFPTRDASGNPVEIIQQRERVFHNIRTYKFMMDGFNNSFNDRQPYDPEILLLEQRIIKHQQATANQGVQATR